MLCAQFESYWRRWNRRCLRPALRFPLRDRVLEAYPDLPLFPQLHSYHPLYRTLTISPVHRMATVVRVQARAISTPRCSLGHLHGHSTAIITSRLPLTDIANLPIMPIAMPRVLGIPTIAPPLTRNRTWTLTWILSDNTAAHARYIIRARSSCSVVMSKLSGRSFNR